MEPVIVAAKRTPFGKYGGIFKHLEPEMLLNPLYEYLLNEHSDALENLSEVVLGNVVGNGGNIARKSLLEARLSKHIPGVTIDRQCGSGLEAVTYACRMIQANAGEIYIAGGVESTSRSPWKIKRPQSVYESDVPNFFERASFAPDGEDPSMIEAAENVAQVYQVSREAQDEFAYSSHQKTIAAIEQGHISHEILPVKVRNEWIDRDESIKPRLNLKTLSRLKPLIKDGTVTVGNSCMKNDGAVLLLIMSKEKAVSLGYHEGLEFVDSVVKGVDPNILGIGPVPAIEQLLKKRDLSINQIDGIEFNEAFSSQVLASKEMLNIPDDKFNIYGGALAIGHPYSASGAQLITRLFHMKHIDTSIATMGIGGGMGHAALFKRWNGSH
ncbi:thiolase family protein [Mammaliicoccus vitulinus]|uniref:thiolase family protein n=1 Tax=Mammaliicoccus vitulinus TaxID=71237 RepID=UPI000D1ECC02|nr:thiolase family protein [Mammaliicoccus vitulinus]PTI36931.1 acetyl-CoA C-acyltransferase [Mammaliicoccus vitulinus]PTI70240.1 acetyl-CoA C-acyltransferase [Mammaliicoccus vitulinus]